MDAIGMDRLGLLALQIEWGADEALDDAPVNRLCQMPVAARDPVSSAATVTAPGAVGAASPRGDAYVHHPATQPAARVMRPEAPDALSDVSTLDALSVAISGFEGCALKETATNVVLATGDPGSGLLIIGDPPGDAEDRSGRPFTGPAGDFLDRVLPPLGLRREMVLLAPLIPWRPPGNRPPTDAELAQCLPFLHRLIALAAPRHLVLLGALAIRALLPAGQNITLRRVRGRWADIPVPGLDRPVPALPTHSPTALRTANDRREAWADWRMLHRSMQP